MCWSFRFGFSASRTHKDPPSIPRKRRERQIEDYLPRSHHHQQHQEGARRICGEHGSAWNVSWPKIDSRSVVQPKSDSSSQDTLLNPRPHRSQCTRQRHPERSSQTTLRGRGAKRVPRRPSNPKQLRPESSRVWSRLPPSPAMSKCQRNRHDCQSMETSARSHRSSPGGQVTTTPLTSRESARSQPYHPGSHPQQQQQQQLSTSRLTRLPTPNTTARRAPDRRFAVLAATNQALENVRLEAFAQPSPPPRRERLRRYEGVSLPTSRIPFHWDCISTS